MTATTGHNGGPALEPFKAITDHIGDLYELAAGCLTGGDIASQAQADQIKQIVDDVIDAEKALEAIRKRENEPFDTGKAAVQAIAKPLADSLKLAKSTAKQPLTAWNLKLDAIREADAKAAKALADELATQVQAKFAETNLGDLEGRQEAEALAEQAKQAAMVAKRIDKVPSGLKTYHVAKLVDRGAFLKWLKEHRADVLTDWLGAEAVRQVNAGQRCMAGVEVFTERRA
jgi:hypothetical protein